MFSFNVVTIGGGGGQAQILKGLKRLPDVRITALVTVADDGRSTGALRKRFNVLGSHGDETKCMAALCKNEELAEILLYRFPPGMFEDEVGHSLKNMLYLAAKLTTEDRASKHMHKLLQLDPHRVFPISKEVTVASTSFPKSNLTLQGETKIDTIAGNPWWNKRIHRITEVELQPPIHLSDEARQAIIKADLIVVCPGDLWSTLRPALLVQGLADAVERSRAKTVLFVNITTKRGETDDYNAVDFVQMIQKGGVLGRGGAFYAIVVNSRPIPGRVQEWLTSRNEEVMDTESLCSEERDLADFKTERADPDLEDRDETLIQAPLALVEKVVLGAPGETQYSIKHDPEEVARVFRKLLDRLPRSRRRTVSPRNVVIRA